MMEASTVQLNDIALFVAVAKRKGFSLTARALNILAATLSPHRRKDAIGIRLINRHIRRLDLTEAGAAHKNAVKA